MRGRRFYRSSGWHADGTERRHDALGVEVPALRVSPQPDRGTQVSTGRATGSRSGAVCGLGSGAAVRKDAELVPLWVGKYDPTLIALADVGVSST